MIGLFRSVIGPNLLALAFVIGAALTVTTNQAAVAQETAPPGAEERSIAEAYIHAYEAQDFDAMRGFYAEDAVFIDPTSFDVPQITNDIHWRGPDAIIAGISNWGLVRGHYRIDRTFVASGRVVFNAEMDVVYATPSGEPTYRYPIITIVTVENGKIAEHRDYTDFNGVTEITD